MHIVSFILPGSDPRRAASWRLGVSLPDSGEIVDVAAAFAEPGGAPAAPPEFLDWFDADGPWWPRIARAAESARQPSRAEEWRAGGVIRARADVEVIAPVPRPGKIMAVGLNYRDHARETGREVPTSPVMFAKFPTAVTGPETSIVLPPETQKVDFEAELAVVIGRRARRVTPAQAAACICGYMNANDVSARDFQKSDTQWVRAKSCDTFAPFGPMLVTADEVGDPGALDIGLRLNGAVMQSSSTRELVFSVPELIAFITATSTLEPGDVLLTGTPAGVGFARRPPVYLKAGDVVEVEIAGLGVLRNHVVGSAVPGAE